MTALRQTPLTCSGHTRPVVDLAFSDITEYGYFLISACKDGKPMLRQGDTGDWVGTFEGHKGAVWGATLNKDASKAATGAADFSAKLWDAVTGDELHSFSHKHIVKCVCFSGDGSQLLTGSNEKLLRIFDLNQPDTASKEFSGHTHNIKRAIFSQDGKNVISVSDDKTIRLWDATSQEEVKKVDLPSVAGDIEMSQDGTTLAVPCGKKALFFNTSSLEQTLEFDIPTQISSVSVHPERSVFVCGGEDFKMYKYDYNTGIELESFKGHFGPIHVIRFSPDGELYASGSEDGTLRLWQTVVGKTYGLWKCVNTDENNVDAENGVQPPKNEL